MPRSWVRPGFFTSEPTYEEATLKIELNATIGRIAKVSPRLNAVE